jgi:hypothetical protein
MARTRVFWVTTAAPLLALASCGGGGGSTSGGAAAQMDLIEVSNGRGLMLPYQVHKADALGNPTSQLVAIRNHKDLFDNVNTLNPVLPVTEWPLTPELPNGEAGNHFVYAQFTQVIDVSTALDPSPAGQANSGLLGPITVLAVDPATGQSVPVVGRAFIGGRTYAGTASGSPPELEFQQWVTVDANGKPVANNAIDNDPQGGIGHGVPDGLGFPGTESLAPNGFDGAAKLVDPKTFVFIPDSDNNLQTHETFPANRQIRLRATTALGASNGNLLFRQVVASSTVGPDAIPPEIATTPPPNAIPLTSPSFGDNDVDPLTKITVEFTEPIQPPTLGDFLGDQPPAISSAVEIKFGPNTQETQVPFTVRPLSVFDFSRWELSPVFAFPGNGPVFQDCSTFNRVRLAVVPQQLRDLAGIPNTQPASTEFTTGEGPGIVNAPVVPDVVYVGRVGATPGISVVDLNGFGQSTGDPRFDSSYLTFPKGWSNFPNNPNLRFYGQSAFPPLKPGVCTVDGGSSGVFTLTRDTSLNDLLVRPPLITSVGEMAVGQSLDLVYHNGADSTGCRYVVGNFCAISGKKVIRTAFQTGQTLGPPQPNQLPAALVPGGANPVSFAPHPNPPGLRFPPLCLQPFIGGEEPTSIYTVTPILLGGLGLGNLLVPGQPLRKINDPPTGILAQFQNAYFEGPDRFLPTPGACFEYQFRQQIGPFLYMLDRARREVVVLNSNRMTVIERIPCPDPTDITMGPDLDFIAVTNQNADTVTFIDIDPASSSFHQVVRTTAVGRGPRGICWDPGNEDILVCNEGDSSVSIISAFTFNVRNTVQSHLNQPFDVVITQRQAGYGFLRNVYFGWILNRNGDLTIFESGPSGVNGWGYDDTIGVAPFNFANPKKIAINSDFIGGSVWIVHEGPLDAGGEPTGEIGGAISRVDVDSAVFGILPLTGFNFFINPQFRDMSLKVRTSIGPSQLTGIPVDIAFDELNNLGAMQNLRPTQGVGTPILINGKSIVRPIPGGATPTIFPDFMFAAVPNSSEGPGVIDVIALTSGFNRFDADLYTPGTQSIPCAGARFLATYFRQ